LKDILKIFIFLVFLRFSELTFEKKKFVIHKIFLYILFIKCDLKCS
jgi:hypothetical protein